MWASQPAARVSRLSQLGQEKKHKKTQTHQSKHPDYFLVLTSNDMCCIYNKSSSTQKISPEICPIHYIFKYLRTSAGNWRVCALGEVAGHACIWRKIRMKKKKKESEWESGELSLSLICHLTHFQICRCSHRHAVIHLLELQIMQQ